MVEAGAKEISEEDMLAAMAFGQEAIAAFCEKQAEFLAKVNPGGEGVPGPCGRSFHQRAHRAVLRPDVCGAQRCGQAVSPGQGRRAQASHQGSEFSEDERAAWGSDIAAELKLLEKHAMRAMGH